MPDSEDIPAVCAALTTKANECIQSSDERSIALGEECIAWWGPALLTATKRNKEQCDVSLGPRALSKAFPELSSLPEQEARRCVEIGLGTFLSEMSLRLIWLVPLYHQGKIYSFVFRMSWNEPVVT
jgi:hypothetical protein